MNLFKLRLGNCDMYKFLFTLSLYFSSSFLSFLFQVQLLRDNDWFFYAWRIFQWHPTQSYAARNEKTYRWQRYSQKRDNGRWPVHVSLLTMIWFDDHVKTIPKKKTIAARQLHASTLVKNLKGAIYINNAALSKNLLKKKNEKPNKRESFSEQLGLGRFISFYTLTK